MIAKIAVSAAIYSIDKPYDYRFEPSMNVVPGQRVRVPFGRSNKRCEGVVLSVGAGDESRLKMIEAVLDTEPLLDYSMLQLAAFLRERYFCTFYDAIKAILPAGVWFREHNSFAISDESWQEKIQRQPVALAVMQTVAQLGGEADESLLQKQFDAESLEKAIKYLLRKKLIVCKSENRRRVLDKTERIAVLCASYEEASQYALSKRRSAPLQSAVLELAGGKKSQRTWFSLQYG